MDDRRTDHKTNHKTVSGFVQAGYGVASGRATNSPYPKGTIEMQTPFFRALGLDLSACFPGTLNVSIAPDRFWMQQPEFTFPNVKWSPEHDPETFSFSRCQVEFDRQLVAGFVYYPHPETKINHFQDPSILEILAPKISGIQPGDRVLLHLNSAEVHVLSESNS